MLSGISFIPNIVHISEQDILAIGNLADQESFESSKGRFFLFGGVSGECEVGVNSSGDVHRTVQRSLHI